MNRSNHHRLNLVLLWQFSSCNFEFLFLFLVFFIKNSSLICFLICVYGVFYSSKICFPKKKKRHLPTKKVCRFVFLLLFINLTKNKIKRKKKNNFSKCLFVSNRNKLMNIDSGNIFFLFHS